jgi:RimJ/RimL family protein N-acetyltransferase
MPGAVFLRGDRVDLRTIEREDVDFVHEYKNRPEIHRSFVWPYPENRPALEEYLLEGQDQGDVKLLICVDDDESGRGDDESGRGDDESGRGDGDDPGDGDDTGQDGGPVPVGSVGLGVDADGAATGDLGIWIAPPYWGEGYGTAASELIVDYAFTERNLHRVEARVIETNTASRRIWESLGFEHEGVLRESEFMDGEYRDMHLYGVLADEWRERRDS